MWVEWRCRCFTLSKSELLELQPDVVERVRRARRVDEDEPYDNDRDGRAFADHRQDGADCNQCGWIEKHHGEAGRGTLVGTGINVGSPRR